MDDSIEENSSEDLYSEDEDQKESTKVAAVKASAPAKKAASSEEEGENYDEENYDDDLEDEVAPAVPSSKKKETPAKGQVASSSEEENYEDDYDDDVEEEGMLSGVDWGEMPITAKTPSPLESHKNLSVNPIMSAKKDLKANVDQSLIPADLSDHCSKFLDDTKHDDKRVARWENAKKDGGKKFFYDDMTQGDIGIMVAYNDAHRTPTHVYTHIGSCSGCDHTVTLSLPGRGAATYNDWFEDVGPASGSGVTWKHMEAQIYGTEHTGDAWEGGGDRSWGNRSKVKALAVLICEVEGLADLEARRKFLRTLPLCGNDLSSCLGDASL